MTAARDHKNIRILPENSAGECAAGVTYLWGYIFSLKVSATLPNGSRKGAVGA